MKIDLTEDEKKIILDVVNEYTKVSKDLNALTEQSEIIKNRVEILTRKMDELSNKEKEILNNLRTKYGKFTLQDISDTIYG